MRRLMIRFVPLLLALSLLTASFTALAEDERLTVLLAALQEKLASEAITSDSPNLLGDAFEFVYLPQENDDGIYALIFANSAGIDGALSSVLEDPFGSENGYAILYMILTAAGKTAKIAGECGITDRKILFVYTADEEVVGKEVAMIIEVYPDRDELVINTDNIFNLAGNILSLKDNFTEEFFFDLGSFLSQTQTPAS